MSTVWEARKYASKSHVNRNFVNESLMKSEYLRETGVFYLALDVESPEKNLKKK